MTDTTAENAMEIIYVDGKPCAVPSAAYKKKMLIPDLSGVKSSLDTVLRRYMKLEHLEKMLRDRQLYFPRASELGDPWEGAYCARFKWEEEERIKLLGSKDLARKMHESWQSNNQRIAQKGFFVSCWHKSTNESEHMWERYGGKVEICTTIRSLIDAVKPEPMKINDIEFLPRIAFGDCEYIDHAQPDSMREDPLTLLYKRLEYKQDLEFRAVVNPHAWGWLQYEQPWWPFGITVGIESEKLIHSVAVKAGSTDDELEHVMNLVRVHGLSIPVRRSDLDDKPFWG